MTIKVTYNVTDVYMSQSVSPVYINVSYSDGGASGGGVWGSITGTLSNQTDLQTALDAKLDESTIDGGTEGQILSKASATDFDFAWINNYAKYLATNVRNQSGSTIGAFQVVYISGATGNKPLISLADADTEATSSKTYGVTATSIANNGTGDVVTAGELSGINTSAFNEGDLLWLSTTAGGVVTSPPAEPAHSVFIGYVVRSHPTLGVIDVAIANGYELNELHGVQITSAANNDGLFYNSSNSLWENKSIATVLGYTPEQPLTFNSPVSRAGNVVSIPQATGSVNGFLSATDWTTFNSKQNALGFTPANAATTLTINGVTFDLSANRSWTIAAGISGSGASGQVTYWTGSSAVSGSADFTWNGNNIVLSNNKGLVLSQAGTNRSISLLAGNIVDNYAGLTIYPAQGSNVGNALIVVPKGTGYSAIVKTGISVFNTDFVADNTNYEFATFRAGGTSFVVATGKNGSGQNRPFLLSSGFADGVTNQNHLWLYTTGNVGINTSSDLGYRLGVVGDTLLRGSGNTSATTALTVQNSSSTNLLTVRNDGTVGIGVALPDVTLDVSNTGTSASFNLSARFAQISTQSGVGAAVSGAVFPYRPLGNQAAQVLTYGVNTGQNIGGTYLASNANTNIGGWFSATIDKNSAANIGIASFAVNNGTSPTQVAGYFALAEYGTSLPTFTNAAIVADNGATTSPIFIGRDNGSTVFTIADGGNVGIGNTPTAAIDIKASTTSAAAMRFRSGTAPTTPNDGDIWFDGTDIKMRIGGVTKTFTLI